MKNIKKIDYQNKDVIDEIYIHDTYFDNIVVSSTEKSVTVDVSEKANGRCYRIIFNHILRLDLNSFDLWGHTNNSIFDIYLNKDYEISKYIKEVENSNDKEYERANIENPHIGYSGDVNKLFAVTIVTDNGNKIDIICEEVVFINLSTEDARYDYN